MFSILTGLALKSTAVFALAWLAALLLRKRSAAARHMVWTAAAASVLALPPLSLSRPVLRVPVPDSAGIVFRANAALQADITPQHPVAATPSVSTAAIVRTPDWRLGLMLLWTIGTAAGLTRILAGFFALWRIRRSAQTSADWQLCPVPVLETLTSVPMTSGILRPVIFMPPDAAGWSEERRHAVLMHELAHIERHDAATHLLARIALAFYWWNPLAWNAWRGFLKEQERAADDMVLNRGVRASEYAGHLLDIARGMGNVQSWAVPMARRSRLEGRLSAILDCHINRRAANRARVCATAVAALAIVAPLAAVHAQDSQPPSIPADLDATIRVAISQKNREILDNAAKAAEDLTKFDTAHTLLESAAAIRAEVSGERSADYAIGLVKLGDLESLRNNNDSAKDFYSRAVQILGSGPEAGHALIALGVSELMAKNPAEADTYFERARSSDPKHEGIALMWRAVANGKNASEAEALYRSAIAAMDPKSSDAVVIMSVFSGFLRAHDHKDEALDLQTRAEGLQKSGAMPRPEPRDGVYRIGEGVSPPAVIYKVDPDYSEEARIAKLSGTIELAAEIGPDGLPHNIVVVRRLGLGLDEKALQAVYQWRFKPGQKDGQPVTVLATIEVNFKLL